MYNPYGSPYGSPFGGMGMQQQTQPLQKYEIIHVNGEAGAQCLRMAPNSNALLLDDTAPLVWLAQTDGAGYKTVTPYSIAPYQPTPPVDVNGLEDRVKRLEEMLSGTKSHDADAKPAKRAE